MGCAGRSKYDDIRPEQKWDFISLNDFKSKSVFTYIAYGYLWLSLGISCAVYGVDTFTAVNLLAFDKWTGIDPSISINISKWIFSGCIILSWLNLAYEHFRAFRVIKRGAVAESYLDSLAVRLQSIRMGKEGRGWRRFLVFAALTESKKGAEYVALFTYFSFQSWVRVIFCSGPRQVVNALTLYSVLQKNLTNTDGKSAGNAILQFFKNIGAMAKTNEQQAVILGSMFFTLVIWVFAALSLILALLFYVLFLWHYIPNSDGGLSGYCERKTNRRLQKIVSVKVNKALEDEERKRIKALQKATKKGEKPPAIIGRQATIPVLFSTKDDEDKLPEMPMLNRNDTTTTLPPYSSRPGTPSSQMPALPGLELSNLDRKRPLPARTGTSSSAVSNTSYASNAPLMAGAADMGYGRSISPAPSLPPLDANGYPVHERTLTGSSDGSGTGQWPQGPSHAIRNGPLGSSRRPIEDEKSVMPEGLSRKPTQDSYFPGPPSRQRTWDNGFASPTIPFTESPTARSASPASRGPLPGSYEHAPRRAVGDSGAGPHGPASGRNTPMIEMPAVEVPGSRGDRNSPSPYAVGSQRDCNSPAPSEAMNRPPRPGPGPSSRSGYTPYKPNPIPRSASAGIPDAGFSHASPSAQRPAQGAYRNMTEPVPQRLQPQSSGDFLGNAAMPPRIGTSQSMRSGDGGPTQGAYGPPGPSGSNFGSEFRPPRLASPASFNSRPGPPGRGPPQGGYRQ
ncbi:MAG: hypothetical protein M1818_003314 [Claussenomyces sp. TS43310]|nr:MAG: hypothetical protein M1818_003314 [Claussenomyces sp. TS43310]